MGGSDFPDNLACGPFDAPQGNAVCHLMHGRNHAVLRWKTRVRSVSRGESIADLSVMKITGKNVFFWTFEKF